jgi:hypothetical protein
MGSLIVFTMAVSQGCGSSSGPKTPPTYEIHANTFSKEELNGPLSKDAQGKGAMVAPPPTR